MAARFNKAKKDAEATVTQLTEELAAAKTSPPTSEPTADESAAALAAAVEKAEEDFEVRETALNEQVESLKQQVWGKPLWMCYPALMCWA
jgi:hypothetical protein